MLFLDIFFFAVFPLQHEMHCDKKERKKVKLQRVKLHILWSKMKYKLAMGLRK